MQLFIAWCQAWVSTVINLFLQDIGLKRFKLENIKIAVNPFFVSGKENGSTN